ncbi:MAG: ABC transporter permease [Zetaproteobacteria bacterium]|nr:MAG: ABC transporter permease [Zetaproteobacteria bacterium]
MRGATPIQSLLLRAGLYPMLFGQMIRRLLRPPFYLRETLLQCEEVGVQSLPVVLLTAIFTGMVLALQSYIAFHRFAAESMTATVVSMSILRELGPVLVGLMVAGRIGAAFAAELGTMRVTEQIDALWTLSTDPIRYLVVPRFLAALLMLPLLVVLADAVGIAGGYLVSIYMLDQNPTTYWNNTFLFLKQIDFYSGLLKALVFGGIISLVGCAEGFYCEGGAVGVGEATTRAVVLSAMSILVGDYLLTAWIFQ